MNPSFSPDGTSLVISGNHGGLLDLYLVTIATGALQQLTADPYADLEATFTPDGTSLVFVTERFSTDLQTLEPGPLRLARLDLATHAVRAIPAFRRGRHLSPQVSADGRTVTFIADPDGVPNLYRIGIGGGPVERLSSVVTGIAGITTSSPALSASSATGRLAFSLFQDDGEAIYVLDPADTIALVPPEATQMAALLPGRTTPGGDVERLLTNPTRGLPAATAAAPTEPYREKLALDFLGQPTVSASVSSFGGQVFGGMSAVFSDMLGDRGLGVQGQIGGTLADFGGAVSYINRKHRWNWSTSLSAWPYELGYLTRTDNPDTGQTQIQGYIERQTVRGAFGATAFPVDVATRLEVSGGIESLSFTREVRTNTYDSGTGQLLDTARETTNLAAPLYLGQASAAIVHDTSYFGATGPVYGSRSRLQIGRTSGTIDYTTVLADWRRYFMPVRPLTIAVRGLHYGRYGPDSEDGRLIDVYAGYPEFVHGYGVGSFTAVECLTGSDSTECSVFRNLRGSRMLVANLEVRGPLPGLFTGQLEYGRVPVDLAFFADAGVAWTQGESPGLRRRQSARRAQHRRRRAHQSLRPVRRRAGRQPSARPRRPPRPVADRDPAGVLASPPSSSSHDSRAGHPGWRRCASFEYRQYSRSVRLARSAPRSRILPRIANSAHDRRGSLSART